MTADLEVLESAVIGPYERPPVVCRPYDPRVEGAAADLIALIETRLPGTRVEHIGSTAVPGCAGKGVIDLVVAYPPGDLQRAREALDSLGFQRQKYGHLFPEDRPMRTGSIDWNGATFQVHVHVVVNTSPEVERLLRFRDRLREDPALLAAYVDQKRELITAGLVEGAQYSEAKGDFILSAVNQT